MAGNRFVRGETVYTLCRPGGGIEKRRYGTVLDVGARGAYVQFDDDGEKAWLSSQRANRLPKNEEERDDVIDKPAPTTAAPTTPKTRGGSALPALTGVAAPAPSPAPVAPKADSPAALLAAIEADGVNPFAMWREMGRVILSRARERVSDAEARVVTAARDVADAEGLLAMARGAHAEAKNQADVARRELAELERVVKTEAA